VLCGPRSTSIRSTSGRSVKARAWKASGTSSTSTATLDSTPIPKAKVPTPRNEMLEFCGCSAGRTTSEDETLPISVKLRTPAAASWAGATTETASGTRWTFSARLLAVTMMSPALTGSGATSEVGPPGCPCPSWVSCASSVCDGAACWAETWVAADRDTIIAVRATVERSIFILPSHCRRSWPVLPCQPNIPNGLTNAMVLLDLP